MHAVITFTKEDLLTNYLFVASKSKLVKRNRRRTWLILLVCCVVSSGASYWGQDMMMMWYCVAAGIIILLFYPWLQKFIYRRHYRRFAEDRFKSLKDSPFEITFSEENIFYKSNFSDVVVKTSQIEDITEIDNYFFIRLNSQDTITIPKRGFNNDELNTYFGKVSAKIDITVHKELNWQWK